MPTGRRLKFCLFALLSVVAGPPVSTAQTFAPGYDTDDPAGVFTPRDRRLQGLLDQAQRELDDAQGDHRQALQSIQRLIDETDDVFTDATMSESFRTRATNIIAGLPEATRRLYEETFGPEARSLLESGGTAERSARREVVRRFFQTSAGADAAFGVAAREMDGGRLLEAARLFDRLRTGHPRAGAFEPELSLRCILCYWRSGAAERASQILEQAVQTQPGLAIAGNTPPDLASTLAARVWLAEQLGPSVVAGSVAVSQWPVPNGSPTRNSSVAAVSPLFDDAWQVPLIDDRDADDPVLAEELATLLEGEAAASRDASWPAIPALTPIVVNDLVVFPSFGLVKAVDIHSGQLRWVALPADQTFADAMTTTTGVGKRQLSAEMNEFLLQRAWLDETSSQISSDGEQVYVLRDSGMVGGLSPQFSAVAQPNHPRLPKSFNALRAYDASGGSWKWEVGGARTRAAAPLAGTFFLGPPLAVDGTLYILGEDLGQVRLHALSPQSGQVQWSVPLANSDADIEEDLNRRLAGLSPTLAGGLLVCPTGSGLVVAVDPMTRTLQWGIRYRDEQQLAYPQRFRRGPFMGLQTSQSQQVSLDELLQQPRWHDTNIVASGCRVLVPTPDVAQPDDERRLLCLNLLDGTVLWQRARGRSLYIGGVHEGTVLLIGDRQAEGVDVENGHTLWTIPLEMPCGRGIRHENLYHVPLQTGEIATIDIATGRLLVRSGVRSGSPLGNLVAVDGRIISQSATQVRSFRPRQEVVEQIARDLRPDPNEFAALAARGELRLHAGDSEAGLADLRRAVADGNDTRSRQLLVTTLLEGLRSDFGTYRTYVDELDRLAADPELRSRFLMTYATGLMHAGETTLGFQQYLRLLKQSDADSPMMYTNDGRWIRQDRRVQGRMAELYAAADDAVRTELDAIIETELAAATPSEAESLVDKLGAAVPRLRTSTTGDSNAATDTRTDLLPSQQEARLLAVRRTSPADQQGIIAARLVELYAAHGRVEPLTQLLSELETVWADEPCLNETTGAEWAAAARERDEITAMLDDAVDWPMQNLDVQEGIGKSNPFAPMRREGPYDPSTSTFLFLPDNQNRLSICDGYGRPLPDGVLTTHPGGLASFQSQYVMQRGHRAVVYQGSQFQLIDLMEGSPRVVMDKLLVEETEPDLTGFRISQRNVIRQQGFRGVVLWNNVPGENGSVGPLNDSIFCFLRDHALHAHDPFTGERFWTVEDVPHGAEIFADEDYVLLVPIGQHVAHVYRALDGEKLGVRTLPADVVHDRRAADWGRHFLRITRDGNDARLAMYDPVAEEDVWQRTVTGSFQWAPLDGYDLCVLDNGGLLVVLDPLTGEVRQQTQVDVPDRMKRISVLSLPDQWLLTTYRPPQAEAEAQLAPTHLPQAAFAINGPITAFERHTGKVMWTRIIANQMITPGLPARWPILSLSAILQAAAKTDSGRVIPILTRRVELINRQTGETAYATQSDAAGAGRHLDSFWKISDVEPQLRLEYGGLELEVSFRKLLPDKPIADPANADDAKSPSDNASPPSNPSPPPPPEPISRSRKDTGF